MRWKALLGLFAIVLPFAAVSVMADPITLTSPPLKYVAPVSNQSTSIVPAAQTATTPTAISSPSKPDLINKTYTLSQINGLDGFSLKGSNATREFYLPILREWTLDSVTLHLLITRAAFLAKSTTLTIYANNRPIESIELSGTVTSRVWDITLPASLAKNKLISVVFTSVVDQTGFSCYNLINPSYWLYVSGDSTVTYHYQSHNYFPDLSKLPYPFIHDPSLGEDNVLVVLPENPGLKILSAAFNVANMLGNRATWKGLRLTSLTTTELTATNPATNSNMILIGRSNSLNLKSIASTWPLPIGTDGSILDKDNHKINNDVGVIMLSPSPFDSKKALLTVTGNTDEGVNNAALMLRDPNFVNTVLYNSQALVLTKPDIVPVRPYWTDVTLQMLGFGNATVYGSATSSQIDYDIDLPHDKKIRGMKLSVNYVVSQFLKSNIPYLTIRVNGNPVGGTSLVVKNEKIKTWNFYIDGANLVPGKNRITFDISILIDKHDCQPQVMSLSWVTVYSSTTFHIDVDNQDNFLNFQRFVSSDNNLIIAIQPSHPFFTSSTFIAKMLELSKVMQQIGYVDFVDARTLVPINLTNSDILYIGDITQDTLLMSYNSAIPFYFANKRLYITPDLLSVLSISNETPFAITELLPSFFNSDYLLLLVTAQDDAGYLAGMDGITNRKKAAIITGNVVFSYQNGTFNSIQSQKLSLAALNKKKINHAFVMVYYGAALLVAFAIISGLVILIRRKIRYYFSKNHDNE